MRLAVLAAFLVVLVPARALAQGVPPLADEAPPPPAQRQAPPPPQPRGPAEKDTVRLHCVPAAYAGGRAYTFDCVAKESSTRDLSLRTHESVLPNGNLLRRGDASLSVHELGLFNRVAYGVSDNVEIYADAPIVPVFASVGGRVGLLPRSSSFRLAVGGGVWFPLIAHVDGALFQAQGTVAYQAKRVNVHASAFLLKPSSSNDAFGIWTAGVAVQTGDKIALFADLARCASLSQPSCGGDIACSSDFSLDAGLFGIKLMGRHVDADVSLLVPLVQDSEIVAFPLVGITYRP